MTDATAPRSAATRRTFLERLSQSRNGLGILFMLPAAGQTFGDLANLSVIDAEGNVREARQSDITNLRWIIATLAPKASGQVSFRARVK